MTNEESPYYLRIERYVKDEMTPDERFALEKDALDDPFLAEAIDGYMGNPVSIQRDMKMLRASLADFVAKQSEKPVPAINPVRRLWWVAAAVVFIVGVWGSYQWMNQQNDAALAKSEMPVEDSMAYNPASVTQKRLTDSAIAPATIPVVEKELSKTTTRPKAASPTALTEKAAQQPERSQAADEIIADAPVARQLGRVQAPNAQEGASIMPYFVQAYITDTAGNAIPFAQVILSGTVKSTTSDINGFFSIPTLDTTLEVLVKASQFAATSHILSIKQASVIVLRPLPSVKHPPIVKDNMEGDAMPAVGWAMYEAYLTNNNKYDGSNQISHKGSVELTFEVDQFGRPSGFNVLRSTCTLCEKEAIRLIKEGPHWQVTNGVAPVVVHLTLQF